MKHLRFMVIKSKSYYKRTEYLVILLFKSLKSYKRRNKGSLTSKSNSDKIMLCGGGGQYYLILNKISKL